MRTPCFLVLCVSVFVTGVYAQDGELPNMKPTDLRLLNTEVFGRLATEPVVLLAPPRADALDPESVMVDISKGRYFAATVRYPAEISFDDARSSVNKVYGKWESESFAADPDLGIWRNTDDEFSIQLSQDGFNVTVIYIKFSMLAEDSLHVGLSRAFVVLEDEAKAREAVGTMHTLLATQDFAKFYKSQCHRNLRERLSETEFLDFIQSRGGGELVQLIKAVHLAIENDQGRDVLISRHNVRHGDEYEFVLVRERLAAREGRRWQLKLKKESGEWRLNDIY